MIKNTVIKWLKYAALFIIITLIGAYVIALYNSPVEIANRQLKKVTAAAAEYGLQTTQTDAGTEIRFNDFDTTIDFCSEYLPNNPDDYETIKKLDLGADYISSAAILNLKDMTYVLYIDYKDAKQRLKGYLYK